MIIKRMPRSRSAVSSFSYGLGKNHCFKGGFSARQNQSLLKARDQELIDLNARAIAVSANNVDPYNPAPMIKQNHKRWGQTQHRNQASQLIISATADDMRQISQNLKRWHRPYALIDCYQELADMSVRFGKKLYGQDYNMAAYAHADGNHGLHVHLFTDLVNPITGRKANGNYDCLERLVPMFDRFCQRYGLETPRIEKTYILDDRGRRIIKRDKNGNLRRDKQGHLLYQTRWEKAGQHFGLVPRYSEKEAVRHGRYSPLADMRLQIDQARISPKVNSFADLRNELKERGITATHLNDGYVNCKFRWDKVKAGRHKGEAGLNVTSYRLGKDYSPAAIARDLAVPASERIETKSRVAKMERKIAAGKESRQQAPVKTARQSQAQQLGLPAELKQVRHNGEVTAELADPNIGLQIEREQVLDQARDEAESQSVADQLAMADSQDHDRTEAEDKALDAALSNIGNAELQGIARGIAANNPQMTYDQVMALAKLRYSGKSKEKRFLQHERSKDQAETARDNNKDKKNKNEQKLTPEQIAYLQQQGMDLE